MAEWVWEDGIGETRAALIEDGRIIRAEIERPFSGPRVGTTTRARFGASLVGRHSIVVKLEGGREAVIDTPPRQIGPGSGVTVEIVREEIFGPRRYKRPKAAIISDDERIGDGPALLDRIAGECVPLRRIRPIDPDLLEQAGWSELIEEARTGRVAFPGGSLLIELTEAMTLIDVDGTLDPVSLAIAGARAAAEAISRLRIGGSIGIDLPTLGDRAGRKAAAEAFDAAMRVPFERTAVNGWGFLQVVAPRPRASLLELIRGDEPLAEALLLYRRAEREPPPGDIVIRANTDVMTTMGREQNDAILASRAGAPVHWNVRPFISRWSGTAYRIGYDASDEGGED